MSPTSRRILVYWLLLLLPSLAVGVAAIEMLRREHRRVTDQSAAALEARRAALEARSRLVVENVELLLGDVQNGVLDTLAAAPDDGLPAFMSQWQASNPLVRATFVAEGSGRLLWPTPESADDTTRGFVRRLNRLLSPEPPWGATAEAEKRAAAQAADTARRRSKTERAESESTMLNVAQAQSARRDVQQLFRASEYAAARDVTTGGAPAAASTAPTRSKPSAAAPAATELSDSAPAKAVSRPAVSEGVRGWRAVVSDGHVHLLGWVQPTSEHPYRGVELDLGGLLDRVRGSLPAQLGPGEGLVLQDDRGNVVHRTGLAPPGAAPIVRLTISNPLLAGWEVGGFLAGPDKAQGTPAFWRVGMLLVILLVAAILTAGGLLLRQATQSERDARQKTSFVANVSHEFKTPLTTIRLYSELLEQDRVADHGKRLEYLRTIGRETQRLARLVNNVLDFSRLEQGRKKFALESLDVAAELTRLLDAHEVRISDAGLRLERDIPPHPVEAVLDRDALEQIALNLIDNACKYAADGGEMLVRLDGDSRQVRLIVADRGPGVPVAHRERIFEKFHRVDESLTAQKAGAGLGLGIARQLARGLGGDLDYRARAGGGAEFVLRLPAAQTPR